MEKKTGGILKPKHEKKAATDLKAPRSFADVLSARFPFEPTEGQRALFFAIGQWLEQKPDTGRSTFVLKGFAGTGKTAFLGNLVKVLPKISLKVQLMAPTGRASKVLSAYTQRLAFTIHKRIFRFDADSNGMPILKRQRNSLSNTLFIVDEASMLGNNPEFGQRGILDELIRFVFEGEDNRLLFVGDTAQLPPVGTDLSLALKPEILQEKFGLEVSFFELTDVVRQELDSGILFNATRLRETIRGFSSGFILKTAGFQDFYQMKSARVLEGVDYAYQKFGMEKTLVLTRTNKQAWMYNRGIRGHILYREEEIESGDWIMIVKNNYTVLDEDSATGFLANGDLARVCRVGKSMQEHNLRLIHLEMELEAGEESEWVDCLVCADLLHSDQPQLSEDQLRTYQDALLEKWKDDEPNYKKLRARLKTDPIANPVQIKFGYALTCHKAQGGQWDAVFIDHGFIKDDSLSTEFYRWLYTAITRARKEVFLIDPDARLSE